MMKLLTVLFPFFPILLFCCFFCLSGPSHSQDHSATQKKKITNQDLIKFLFDAKDYLIELTSDSQSLNKNFEPSSIESDPSIQSVYHKLEVLFALSLGDDFRQLSDRGLSEFHKNLIQVISEIFTQKEKFLEVYSSLSLDEDDSDNDENNNDDEKCSHCDSEHGLQQGPIVTPENDLQLREKVLQYKNHYNENNCHGKFHETHKFLSLVKSWKEAYDEGNFTKESRGPKPRDAEVASFVAQTILEELDEDGVGQTAEILMVICDHEQKPMALAYFYPEENKPKTYSLISLLVNPQVPPGTGAGTAAILSALSRGYNLEFESAPSAELFYRRLGFTRIITDYRPRYYGMTTEQAKKIFGEGLGLPLSSQE